MGARKLSSIERAECNRAAGVGARPAMPDIHAFLRVVIQLTQKRVLAKKVKVSAVQKR